MNVSAAVARGRALAEDRMLDTCRVTRPGDGARTIDPTTLQYVDPDPVVVYEGKCRVPRRGTGNSTSLTRGGDAAWVVGEFPLELPFDDDSANVAAGHTIEYLSSVDDPSLVGRVFGVTEVAFQSQATARRFVMKAVVR